MVHLKLKVMHFTGSTKETENLKLDLTLELDSNNDPVAGVGPGIGIKFAEAYFPRAHQIIRIASAYFSLNGYRLVRKHFQDETRLSILVGNDDGRHVQQAVLDEISLDLGQCQVDLWASVSDLAERIQQNRIIIRDARGIRRPFHAKFYICDSDVLWHGSANFSEGGLKKQAEQLSRSIEKDRIQRFTHWHDNVAANSKDLLVELTERLERWLRLEKPFDIYLRTLLLLSDTLNSPPLRLDAHTPTYFQKSVVAQALSQINIWGGTLAVVATGLGKTVIGAEIALRLGLQGKIKRVILIAPYGVQSNWREELEGRDIFPKIFNNGILFQQETEAPYHQISQLLRELKQADDQTLIIVDEAHFYRNQLAVETSEERVSRVYQRILGAVSAGAKIVLLTATAFGTSTQNFNSLLYLLPHRNASSPGSVEPWSASSTDGFAALPVVTILGLPRVLKLARLRGEVDPDERRFFLMNGAKHYLPKGLNLHAVRYRLPLQNELQSAFDSHCFNSGEKRPQRIYDDEKQKYSQTSVDTAYNLALSSWIGSLSAIKDNIKNNLEIPGKAEVSSFQSDIVLTGSSMALSKKQREAVLRPLLHKLDEVQEDDKFSELEAIIVEHCFKLGGKVLIFIDRHLTARYLNDRLEQKFGTQLRIGCTVASGETGPGLKSPPQRSDILKRFSPRSNKYASNQEYDVLICTDADGVGVNLQDADALVNYDPPAGADTLFQRVGRVLRMTQRPERVVHIYTLVPALVRDNEGESRVQESIYKVFSRLAQRHDTSKRILGSGVISDEEHVFIPLDDEANVEELAREGEMLQDVGGLGFEARLKHAFMLEKNLTRASNLATPIMSARGYSGREHRMFVLLNYEGVYHSIRFNHQAEKLEPWMSENKRDEDLEAVNLIGCEENEPLATVGADRIEHLANLAVQEWCKQNNKPLEEVSKVCALYLVPSAEASQVNELLRTSWDKKVKQK